MITSPDNDALRKVRKLAGRRWRDKTREFVAEGEDLIAAADEAGWRPTLVLREGVDVTPHLLKQVSQLGSGTRALAVYGQRWAPAPVGPLCVALWGVNDPGNVGAVLRSALAFGASSVAVGPDCADPFGPRAVRASMGAIFAMPIARVDDVTELPGMRIALVAHSGEPLTGPLDQEATILVGAERTGLPDAVLAACDRVAQIPIRSESLNAAMAATVALYEATRGAGTARPIAAAVTPPAATRSIARVPPA
jgi:RNA methyltransferase, TrmH family